MDQRYRFDPDSVTLTQLESRIPIVERTDVVVAGGGVAGIGAAIGAARAGARTLLIEGSGILGGAATASFMNLWVLPRDCVNGISREVYDYLGQRKGAILGKAVPFHLEAFKNVALELLQKASVKLLFYTSVVDVVKADNRVVGLVIENKAGRQAILAKCIVDTTGDADVCARGGVPCIKGRESDHQMRPVSVLFRMENVDVEKIAKYRDAHPEEFAPDPGHNILDLEAGLVRVDGFFSLTEAARSRGEIDESCHYLRLHGIVPTGRGIITVNSTRIYHVDGTSADDLTRSYLDGQRQIQRLVQFLRKDIPGFDEASLLDTASAVGVRETRRIRGEYVLTENDVATPVVFPDSIAREHSFVPLGIETHSPDGAEGSAQDPFVRGKALPIREYFIPYRSLVPLQVDGLLVGGRCISVTHEADSWTRTQTTCLTTGQAAGVAAALAAAREIPSRNLDVRLIQKALTQQGVDLGRASAG